MAEEEKDQPIIECPICTDHIKNPLILKCKHQFCDECIHSWLEQKNTCPLCRMKDPTHPRNSSGVQTWLQVKSKDNVYGECGHGINKKFMKMWLRGHETCPDCGDEWQQDLFA